MAEPERTIRVEVLTRVEGEGALHIHARGGELQRVELRIFEPPRLFESLLRGRSIFEAADITARICGICPVAYQMTTVHAIEAALGIVVPPEIRQLRRLLYCGEWIESHSLHIHLLHAPDFLGYESGLKMATDHRAAVERGLRLKKHGNQLLAVLGGRAVHPVNVTVGGFFKTPSRAALQQLIPDFEWGLAAAIEMARWVAQFDKPETEIVDDCQVCLRHPDEYPFNAGRVVSTDGLDLAVEDYEQEFVEHQEPHSTALHSVRRANRSPYLVGPLARVNLCGDQLTAPARELKRELGWTGHVRNRYWSIVARALEVVHAYAEALELLRGYRPLSSSRVAAPLRAAAGSAATEAPRGLIYHRFEIDDAGCITRATIIPPTSQNQARIEADLAAWLPTRLHWPDELVAQHAERLIRNYDPCISCSTHFLQVRRHSVPTGS